MNLAAQEMLDNWSERYRSLDGRSQVVFRSLAGIVAALVVLLGGVTVWARYIKTSSEKVAISGLGWERKIHLERFQTMRDADWSVPDLARNPTGSRKVHHYDSELYSDYECQPATVNGSPSCRWVSRTRQVPVYATWYEYDIDRWNTIDSLVTSGDSSVLPVWEGTEMRGFNRADALGNVREARRSERFWASVRTAAWNEEQFTVATIEVYSTLSIGKVVWARVTASGNIRSVNFTTLVEA